MLLVFKCSHFLQWKILSGWTVLSHKNAFVDHKKMGMAGTS
jgi:hypothetical protein